MLYAKWLRGEDDEAPRVREPAVVRLARVLVAWPLFLSMLFVFAGGRLDAYGVTTLGFTIALCWTLMPAKGLLSPPSFGPSLPLFLVVGASMVASVNLARFWVDAEIDYPWEESRFAVVDLVPAHLLAATAVLSAVAAAFAQLFHALRLRRAPVIHVPEDPASTPCHVEVPGRAPIRVLGGGNLAAWAGQSVTVIRSDTEASGVGPYRSGAPTVRIDAVYAGERREARRLLVLRALAWLSWSLLIVAFYAHTVARVVDGAVIRLALY